MRIFEAKYGSSLRFHLFLKTFIWTQVFELFFLFVAPFPAKCGRKSLQKKKNQITCNKETGHNQGYKIVAESSTHDVVENWNHHLTILPLSKGRQVRFPLRQIVFCLSFLIKISSWLTLTFWSLYKNTHFHQFLRSISKNDFKTVKTNFSWN